MVAKPKPAAKKAKAPRKKASRSKASPGSAATDVPSNERSPVPSEAGIVPSSDAPGPVTTIVVQQQQQQGPAYTCGRGGQLRAEHAALFFGLVGLTYFAGVYFLLMLLLFVLFWASTGSAGQGCAMAGNTCTCQGPSGNAGCDGGGGDCCDGDCCDGDCCGDCCGDGGGGGCCGDGDCCGDGGGSGGSGGGAGDCCGDSGGSSDSSDGVETPGAGTATVLGGLAGALGLRRLDAGWLTRRLAHHPDHPDFAADVLRLAAVRACIGCVVTFPAFFAAIAILTLATPLAWMTALAVGIPLALLQAISSAGWARAKWSKVAVKLALGIGLALTVHGVLAAPLNRFVQAGILLGLLVLASLSAQPRKRRIAAWRKATETW